MVFLDGFLSIFSTKEIAKELKGEAKYITSNPEIQDCFIHSEELAEYLSGLRMAEIIRKNKIAATLGNVTEVAETGTAPLKDRSKPAEQGRTT
jgi:hypothetical protein